MNSESWSAARPIVFAGLILLSAVALLLIVLRIREILVVIFLGMVIGVALNPLVGTLEKARVPRIASVLLVYLIVAALLGLFIYFAAVEVARENFTSDLDRLRADYDELREGTALPNAEEVERGLTAAARNAAGGIAGRVFSFASALLSIFTLLFTALLFSVTQDRMKNAFLSFIHPSDRPRIEALLHRMAKGLRGYMRGEVIAMFVIGTVTYLGLIAIGVKLPLILAFIAFLFELVPMVGPWAAFLPALVVGLTDGFWTGLQVTALYAGIQAFENYVVTPVVHGRESEMPALLVFAAILIGAALMGVLGALAALPVAVVIQVFYVEMVVPWNERRHASRDWDDDFQTLYQERT